MKTTLLPIMCLFFPIMSFAGQPDVFENNTWYLDYVQLSIHSHEEFQGYNYSLTYTTLDGANNSTDMCSITTANTLHCITGDTVVVDSENHSATLNNKITYFEKGYQPQGSPLSGHWHSDNAKWCETDIIIPYANYDATTFYPASIHGATGSESLITFYLAYGVYSHEFYFGRDPQLSHSGYRLYDKNNQLIEGMQDISKVVKLMNHDFYRDCIYTKI